MKKFIKVMKALSDPNRVRILKILQKGSRCVYDINQEVHVAQPTISKHLKILEDSGLVTFKKKGRWVFYQIADGSDSPYAASMLGNLKHWLNEK